MKQLFLRGLNVLGREEANHVRFAMAERTSASFPPTSARPTA
jgi:hypothetical protein